MFIFLCLGYLTQDDCFKIYTFTCKFHSFIFLNSLWYFIDCTTFRWELGMKSYSQMRRFGICQLMVEGEKYLSRSLALGKASSFWWKTMLPRIFGQHNLILMAALKRDTKLCGQERHKSGKNWGKDGDYDQNMLYKTLSKLIKLFKK